MAKLGFGSVMVGSENPKKLGEFYEKVFGKKPDMSDPEGMYGWATGRSFVNFYKHDEVKGQSQEPKRVILNYETEDVKGEFERIKDIGAEVVKEPYELQGMWIATLADPDGNYFQLMSPWEGDKK